MEVAQIINQQSEVARKKLIQKAEQNKSEDTSSFQGLLFVGNRHETVPFRLLTDKYLTPRAKTAWQMIKLNAQQFQGAAFPSYEELSYWLSDRGFQNKRLSRKTISQTLLLLRLTRWLTLCETVRNTKGQVLGNVYVMNDEPLSIGDCLQLNGDYLRLLEKSTKHADPLIKDVATAIVDEILEQKQLWHFVSHLSVIRSRYQQLEHSVVCEQRPITLSGNLAEAVHQTQQKLLSSNMELSNQSGELSQKMNNSLSSNMELSKQNDDKSLILGSVPKWNSVETQYSTSTKNIKYSTCTASQQKPNYLALLEQLKLSSLEKETARQEMSVLSEEIQEAVLFEVHQRTMEGKVKKTMSYLMSLIQRAKSGDFNPYLIHKTLKPTPPESKTINLSTQTVLHTPRIEPRANKQNPLDIIRQLAKSLHH